MSKLSEAEQVPDTFVFVEPRAKVLRNLGGTGGFVALGAVLLAFDNPAGWLVVVVFGAFSIVGLAALVWRPGVHLDREGLTARWVLRSKRVRWSEVETVGVQVVGVAIPVVWLRADIDSRRTRDARAHRGKKLELAGHSEHAQAVAGMISAFHERALKERGDPPLRES